MKTYKFDGKTLSISEPVDCVGVDGVPFVAVREWGYELATAGRILGEFDGMPDEIRQQIEAA